MIDNLLLMSNKATPALFVLVIIFAILTFIAWLVACIMKFNVWITYKKYNKIVTLQGIDAKTNAQFLLNKQNLNEIKVQKCGFWRGLFGYGVQGFGNSYSPSKKTIFLRKNIIDKATITAIGVTSQRVGQAVLDKRDDKQFKLICKLRPIYIFAPILFMPIVAIFAILDICVFKTEGLIFAIVSILAFVYLIGAFIMMLFTIPVEKRANKIAIDNLRESGLYTEEEIAGMEVVLNSYIKSYIADFIYAVVQIIYEILKLVARLTKRSK